MNQEERRQYVKEVIEKEGIHNINNSELGRKLGVTHTQIKRDIEIIMSKIPPVNWVSIFNTAQKDFDRTLQIANKAMENSKDGKTKAKLASQISEMLLRKMNFLEKMERLLPASAKPEPVTITYSCVDPSSFVKESKCIPSQNEESGSEQID